MHRALAPGLIAFALAAGAASQDTFGSADRFLALGISQLNEGNFEDAIFSLDTAIRNLSAQPAGTKQLIQAYVHLGAAYVGLENEDAAKGKFRRALELEPAFRISPEQFPPRVLKVFDEEVARRVAAGKKRGAKLYLALGGVGAAAAVGIGAAKQGTELPPNRPPTSLAITPSPPGQAIPGITVLTLTATAADPDGDALSYRWELGDGATAEGLAPTHRYESEGTFRVTLTASDSRGGSSTAAASVVARSLSGAWFSSRPDANLKCTQAGAQFACLSSPYRAESLNVRGTLSHPRLVELGVLDARGNVSYVCRGEAEPSLDCVRCSYKTLSLELRRGNGCR